MVLDSSLVLNGNHERWNIDQLVVDSDVSVLDLGSGVVDRLGKLGLVNPRLKSSLEESVNSQTEAVIELVLLLSVQKTVFVHSVKKCSSLEKSLRIVFLKGQQGSGCLSDLGQGELNSPDFSLVLETVVAALLNFSHNTFLLERSSWGLEGLRLFGSMKSYRCGSS